jgi:hypothetical protein
MNKDAYYFSHDYNARNDIKIKALRRKYGMEGYGRWWVTVELLREQSEFKLPLDEFIFETLAEEYTTTTEEAKTFILDCCDRFNLFVHDSEYFWSQSLLIRMERMQNIREKRAEAGRRSAEARQKKKDNL